MGITRIFETLGELLPAPVYYGIIIVLIVVGFPGWLYSIRSRQVRGAYRRWMGASPDERSGRFDELFDKAGTDRRLLSLIADESVRLKQFLALNRAIEVLVIVGAEAEVTRYRQQSTPEPVVEQHPLQVAMVIENMRREGLDAAADDRLARALERYGDVDDLVALKR